MNNLAKDGAEMVRILARRTRSGLLQDALEVASGHDLFVWWHEAQAHAMTADKGWEKKLCEALGGEIAKEAVRRCGLPVQKSPSN